MGPPTETGPSTKMPTVSEHLRESAATLSRMANNTGPVEEAAAQLCRALQSGNKLITFGNGGSAADAQHFAGELMCRFETERNSLPAVALSTDTSVLTAIGNDYAYEQV